MKTRLLYLALLLVSAWLWVGCGDSGGDMSSPPSTNQPPAAPAK